MTQYDLHKSTLREKRQNKAQWFFGTASRALIFGALAFFSVLYVIKISAISAKGYDISALQREISSLNQENQKLKFEIAKHQSMSSIESRLHDLKLVAIGDGVRYIDERGALVARR